MQGEVGKDDTHENDAVDGQGDLQGGHITTGQRPPWLAVAEVRGLCYLAFMGKPKRRALILVAVTFLAGIALRVPAESDRDTQRVKLVSLETALSSRQALIGSKWRRLAQIEGALKDLSSTDEAVLSDPELRSAAGGKELLKNARARAELSAEWTALLRELDDLYQETAVLQEEIAKVRSGLQEAQQVLDGKWTLTLMPAGTRGDVFLSQNGTLVTGEYHLENGQSGSLQGTVVNGVIMVERIDARYGKMGRLEGSLMGGNQAIRGTWFSYDIASGQPISGPFTLDRPPEEAAP